MIPYGRQEITGEDIDSILRVLNSDFLTQGPVVEQFEKAVFEHVGAQYGVAVNSATSALHLACLAIGLSAGDWLWTSPITFVASANCGIYCGAKVDFVDIDPRTYNICAERLEDKLIKAEKNGCLPKVLVAVHLCGQPCNMEKIHSLAKKYRFRVIEDASHAIGGKYKGAFIGGGQFSDITVFSFHPVKIVTTAEGGLAVTNCEILANKMKLLRSHGITRDRDEMRFDSDGPWYYEQIALGFNYRMTDIQAALGVSQMKRLDSYVLRRHEVAAKYDKELASLPLLLPWQHPDSYSGMHLYVVRLQIGKISNTHRGVFEALRELGVGVNLHYIPVHMQPYYKNFGFNVGDFPEAESYYGDAISLPIYPTLSEDEQASVVDALHKVLS